MREESSSGCLVFLKVAIWIASGYICYQLLEPKSFGSLLIFLAIWHVVAVVFGYLVVIIAVMFSD